MTINKLTLVAALSVTLMLPIGCGDHLSEDSAAAKNLLDDHFRLKDFDRRGVFFTDFSSRREIRPRLKGANTASSFSPDLTGFTGVKFFSTGRQDHIVVRLTLGRGFSGEVCDMTYDARTESPADVMQLDWASVDGSAVFVREHGSLWLATFCGDRIARTLLAENTHTFAATSERIFYIQNDSRNVLRWRPIPGATGVAGSQILPDTYNSIQVGSMPTEVLVFNQDWADGGLFKDISLIDTVIGSFRRLPIKNDLEIIQLKTIKGAQKAVVEVKRGSAEKLDGSISSYLALWDYNGGSVVPFFEARGSLDQLPKNVYLLTEASMHEACYNLR